jgi:hypothetical protein
VIQAFLETQRLVLHQIENEVLPACLGYYQRYEGFGFWAAAEKTTGNSRAGSIFRPRQDAVPGEAELGHRLRKSAWGKEFATEGSRALICKGFAEFGVQRALEAMPVNMALRRVMEKAALRPSKQTSPLCLAGAAVAAPVGGLAFDRECSSRCARNIQLRYDESGRPWPHNRLVVSSAGRDAPRECPKHRAHASGAGIWQVARPDDLPRAVQGFVGLTG